MSDGAELQVIFHDPGPTWARGVPFREQPNVELHIGFMQRLHDEGVLVIGGPFLDESGGGMVVVDLGSVEEAQRWALEDPSVEAGLVKPRVRPWYAPMRR